MPLHAKPYPTPLVGIAVAAGSWAPSCRRRSASGSSQGTSPASRPTSAGPSSSPGCSRWRSRRSHRSRSATGSPSTRARRPGTSPRSSSSPRGGHDLAQITGGMLVAGVTVIVLGLARFDRLLLRVFTPLHGHGVRPRRHRRRDADHARARGRRHRRSRRAGRPPDGSRPQRRSPSRSCSSAAVRCARTRCSARCWRGRPPRSSITGLPHADLSGGIAAPPLLPWGAPEFSPRRRAPVHHRRADRRLQHRRGRRDRVRRDGSAGEPAQVVARASRSTAGRRSEARCSATSSGPSAGSTRCRSPGCSAPIGARRSRSRR